VRLVLKLKQRQQCELCSARLVPLLEQQVVKYYVSCSFALMLLQDNDVPSGTLVALERVAEALERAVGDTSPQNAKIIADTPKE